MRIHNAAHLPACIDNNTQSFSISQVAVTPQSVLKTETLAATIVLCALLNFKEALKMIDV
jgi:hypothetical protein